jgi:hypothetical protein
MILFLYIMLLLIIFRHIKSRSLRQFAEESGLSLESMTSVAQTARILRKILGYSNEKIYTINYNKKSIIKTIVYESAAERKNMVRNVVNCC